MARTDYIQPDPINSRSGTPPFGSLSGGNRNRNQPGNVPQLGGLRNAANNTVDAAKGTASEIYNQGALPLLGRSASAINSSVIQPTKEGLLGAANNVVSGGRNLLLGANNFPQGERQNNQLPYQQAPEYKENAAQLDKPIDVGYDRELQSPGGLQNYPASTEAPGTNQTSKYRDALIGNDGNSVSFGDGKGSVSGLNPEQAARIQKSLASGNQATGFSMDNMISSARSGTDEKIMEAMRGGLINADKASALMNRDFRASERMDRLGGNAQAYIKPDQNPTNLQEAVSFGQNLNNFTRNGELNEKQALLAQKNYLGGLGGYKGIASATPNAKTQAEINKLNAETEQIKKGKSTKSGAFKPAFSEDFISTLPPEHRNNARLTSDKAIFALRENISKLSSTPDIMAELEEFAADSKLPVDALYSLMQE